MDYPRVSWRSHDDVIKWKHFPSYRPFVPVIHWSPVNFPHKGQWRGALVFSLIAAWLNDLVNNRDAGDLRRHYAYYDVIVMWRPDWEFVFLGNEYFGMKRIIIDIRTIPELQMMHYVMKTNVVEGGNIVIRVYVVKRISENICNCDDFLCIWMQYLRQICTYF